MVQVLKFLLDCCRIYKGNTNWWNFGTWCICIGYTLVTFARFVTGSMLLLVTGLDWLGKDSLLVVWLESNGLLLIYSFKYILDVCQVHLIGSTACYWLVWCYRRCIAFWLAWQGFYACWWWSILAIYYILLVASSVCFRLGKDSLLVVWLVLYALAWFVWLVSASTWMYLAWLVCLWFGLFWLDLTGILKNNIFHTADNLLQYIHMQLL